MITFSSLKYPSSFLHRYIYYYTYTEAEFKDDFLHYNIFPAPNIRLYFNFRDKGVANNLNDENFRDSLHGVLGIQTQTNFELTIPQRSTFKHMVVFFKPAGFFQMFNTPASIVTNLSYSIDEILDKELGSIASQLSEKEGFSHKIKILENYFLKRLIRSHRPLSKIEYAVEKIMHTGYGINIKQVASDCNLCLRQFERKFKEITGVTPISLHSIKRFDLCLRLKEKMPAKTWTKIAHEAGYADQMHMIRDFKKFTNTVPSSCFSYDIQAEGKSRHMLRELVNA